MNQQIRRDSFWQRFVDEILLNSGQYALFYILMNFSSSGIRYFTDLGHSLLLLLLIGQTTFLAIKGSSPILRFFGSLLIPAAYTLIELREGLDFVLNMGHIFFWIFSILTGALQVASLTAERRRWKAVPEFALIYVNVLIFIFIYFYFDLTLQFQQQLDAGQISDAAYQESLQVSQFAAGFRDFLADPAHIYVILGGALLGTTVSIGRWKIVVLKDRINQLFGMYVDDEVRDQIMSADRLESERKRMCVLFSDIRSFTSKSESQKPEAVTQMLNRYFTAWDDVVVKHGGIIDKFIGDAIMVVFDAADERDACERAVNSALEMVQALPALDDALAEAGLPRVGAIGVGVHLGDVVVGDIGSERRKNYTVIGDSVNVASRLEAASKSVDATVVVSQEVFAALTGDLQSRFKHLGRAQLRGKSDRIAVYGAG